MKKKDKTRSRKIKKSIRDRYNFNYKENKKQKDK